MTGPSKRLKVAIQAARAAGKILHEKFDGTRTIHSKGARDIVTDADFAADHCVRALVHKNFPGDQFLSEEDSAETRKKLWTEAERPDAAYLWVVDPLDGTVNYAHRIPMFAVSIGLYHRGEVVLGVVYDPIRDELFAAEQGHGATLNGKKILAGTRPIEDAVISVDFARKRAVRTRTTRVLARLSDRALTARSTGSAALSLCYVACGRFDVYFHFSLSPWDVAAAAHIIEQAGGSVTTPWGKPWSVHSKAYLATNGHLKSRVSRYFRA